MRFIVYMSDPADRERLLRLLRVWMEYTCVSAELVTWDAAEDPWERPAILFWDMDSGETPPWPDKRAGKDCAFFACSSSGGTAISCYAIHPTGFLQKPVQMEALSRGLNHCVKLWWDALIRLDLLSGRVHLRIPVYELRWIESNNRGCVIHTSTERIPVREPLSGLEQRLPRHMFIRCQRSYLVNLCHVADVTGGCVYMSDGAEIPISRDGKGTVLERFLRFRSLMADGIEEA